MEEQCTLLSIGPVEKRSHAQAIYIDVSTVGILLLLDRVGTVGAIPIAHLLVVGRHSDLRSSINREHGPRFHAHDAPFSLTRGCSELDRHLLGHCGVCCPEYPLQYPEPAPTTESKRTTRGISLVSYHWEYDHIRYRSVQVFLCQPQARTYSIPIPVLTISAERKLTTSLR